MANVIIADNDLIIRSILRSILAGIGQTVFVASGGEEAIDLASNFQAQLILLDLNMPKLNGLLACEKLRRLPGYAYTPIVILSGHNGDRERQAASRVGATQFLSKPFQPAELLQSLAIYLDVDLGTQESIAKGARRAREISASDPVLQARSRSRAAGQHSPPQGMLDQGKTVLDICRSSQAQAVTHAPQPAPPPISARWADK